MSLKQRIGDVQRGARPIQALTVGMAAQAAVNAAQGIVLARVLGLADFGVFAIATSAGAVAYAVGESRTWEAVVVHWPASSSRTRISQARQRDLAVGLARLDLGSAGVTLLISTGVFVGWPGDLAGPIALGLVGAALRLTGGATQGVLRAANQFNALMLIEVLIAALSTLAVISLALAGLGPAVLIGVMTISYGLRSVLLAAAARRELEGWSPRSGDPVVRELRAFLLSGYGIATIKSAVVSGDVLVAGGVGGIEMASLLRAAKAPSALVGLAQNPAVQIHTHHAHGGAERTAARRSSRRSVATRGVAGACLAALLAWPTELVLGAEFDGVAYPAVLLAGGSAIWGYANALQLELLAERRFVRALGTLTLGALVVLLCVALGARVNAAAAASGLAVGAITRLAVTWRGDSVPPAAQ